MHPNAAFRPNRTPAEERALCEALIPEVGFGMVFASTPDGPRVAHAPLPESQGSRGIAELMRRLAADEAAA